MTESDSRTPAAQGKPAEPKVEKPRIVGRICRWVGFSVLVALAPVYIAWYLSGTGLDKILSRGELFILSSGITAAALGELLGPRSVHEVLRSVLAVLCVVILVLAIVAYVAGTGIKGLRFTEEDLARQSLQIFGASVFVGALVMGFTTELSSR